MEIFVAKTLSYDFSHLTNKAANAYRIIKEIVCLGGTVTNMLNAT